MIYAVAVIVILYIAFNYNSLLRRFVNKRSQNKAEWEALAILSPQIREAFTQFEAGELTEQKSTKLAMDWLSKGSKRVKGDCVGVYPLIAISMQTATFEQISYITKNHNSEILFSSYPKYNVYNYLMVEAVIQVRSDYEAGRLTPTEMNAINLCIAFMEKVESNQRAKFSQLYEDIERLTERASSKSTLMNQSHEV